VLREHESGATYSELAIKYYGSKKRRGKIAGMIRDARKVNGQPIHREPEQEDSLTENCHSDNVKEILAKGKQVRTLDDLIQFAEIDLTVWEVKNWIANAWNVTNREGQQYTNAQVKAWLYKIKPEPIDPAVQPVSVTFADSKPPKPTKKRGLVRELLWTDPHVGFRMERMKLQPFHDRRVLNVLWQIMQSEGISTSRNLGDLLDMSEWSDKFTKEQGFYFTTQPALIEAAYWLQKLNTVSVNEGNHENRLPKAMLSHYVSAYGLRNVADLDGYPIMSIPHMLNFAEAGIQWGGGYPEDEIWLNEEVRIIHGLKLSADKQTKDTPTISTIAGHIHRREEKPTVERTRTGRKVHKSLTLPCCCHVDGRVPGHTKTQDWTQGAAIIEYDPDGTWWNIEHIDIVDGVGYYRGKEYHAQDCTAEIVKGAGEYAHLF
jgi:hypothetical protein